MVLISRRMGFIVKKLSSMLMQMVIRANPHQVWSRVLSTVHKHTKLKVSYFPSWGIIDHLK